MAKPRVRGKRAVQPGGNGQPPRRPGPKAKARSRRAVAQRGRRLRDRAADLAVQVIAQLVRLQVLSITSMSMSTEVARMKILADKMLDRRVGVSDAIGVLVLDYAARAHELTRTFITWFRV